jgi:hypothetical protein
MSTEPELDRAAVIVRPVVEAEQGVDRQVVEGEERG